ncbi:bifunctional class I SAM-dependent methyltransferase/GNAT family N-acetyltransferase [Streptomyces sp. B6B3]|uniref:bifunctional class I SAM-dependent methyltransferase/GNAT family N-acetyltransferase n=1 Tax=Streptomyces sp. B6B3 TaxID=3153570 RepID=UPI00325D0C25
MDWQGWHDHYDAPGSQLARRLRVVQERIGAVLDEAPPGPLRVISLCAGQGRDLLEVLDGHRRRGEIRALLVERDPRNAALAREAVAAAGLEGVEVVTGDAALTDHYRGLAPADLVLVCGLFGNIVDEDIRRTVGALNQLCASGGAVIWTRHRGAPDRVPVICDWFEELGFERRWLSAPEAGFGVGVHRFRDEPRPLREGVRLFSFAGYDVLRNAIDIVPLRPGDRAGWEVLARGYKAFYETPLADEVYEETWRRLLSGEELHGLGAWLDGRLVGIAHHLFHATFWMAESCYLQDLFVSEAARGHGVARALIERVAQEARSRGAARLYWTTREDNAPARALYDKVARFNGFVRYDHPLAGTS